MSLGKETDPNLEAQQAARTVNDDRRLFTDLVSSSNPDFGSSQRRLADVFLASSFISSKFASYGSRI